MKLFTFTKHGNKHPWLIADDEEGKGKVIATLKVPTGEFWKRLGDGLEIVFLDSAGKPIGIDKKE